jgi:hypothetical protein
MVGSFAMSRIPEISTCSGSVRVPRETGEEGAHLLLQERVDANLVGEILELLGGGQLVVHQEVGDLEERRPLGQLLDRVTAVAENAGVTIDVGDRRRGRSSVHKTLVEGDEAGLLEEGADVDAARALDRLAYRHRQLATRVVELDIRHVFPSLHRQMSHKFCSSP